MARRFSELEARFGRIRKHYASHEVLLANSKRVEGFVAKNSGCDDGIPLNAEARGDTQRVSY